MASALAPVIKPISTFQVAKVPVGKALVLSAGMGFGDVLKALVARFAPAGIAGSPGMAQLLTGFAAAWALSNTKFVRNILGPELSDLVGLAIMADTIDDQVNVRQTVTNFLAQLTGGTVVSRSPSVWSRGATSHNALNGPRVGANQGTVAGLPSGRNAQYAGVV